eukprot:3636919-Pleurochrysis_carterae.AAC.4
MLYLMLAFSANEAIHGLESALSSTFGRMFPGETPNKVELKQFLDSFQEAMDQKAYGTMTRGELPHALQEVTMTFRRLRTRNYRTGFSKSGASRTSRTRKQDEARFEGGAGARLLESHRFSSGDSYMTPKRA